MSVAVSIEFRCFASGFLEGDGRRLSKGKTNAALVGEILERKLKA